MEKMPILFDYDGVLGDTEKHLFDNYYKLKRTNPLLTKELYVRRLDWHNWLRRCGPLNNSFEILKSHPHEEAEICTTCWSINEAKAKILYIREIGIKNNIIIVPGGVKKSMVVDFRGKLFVEDNVENIADCLENGGEALYFGSHLLKIAPTIENIEDAFYYASYHKLP